MSNRTSGYPPKSISALFCVLLIGVTACGTSRAGSNGGPNSPSSFARDSAIVVGLNKCPIAGTGERLDNHTLESAEADVAGTLLGVGASVVSDVAIKLIGNAIERRRQNKTGQFLATGVVGGAANEFGEFRLASGTHDLGCLVVAKGKIGARGTYSFPNGMSTLGNLVPLRSGADFYMEIEVTEAMSLRQTMPIAKVPAGVGRDDVGVSASSDEERILKLQPVALHYANAAAKRPEQSQNLAAVVIFSSASVNAGATSEELEKNALSVYRHNFGKVQVGSSTIDPTGTLTLAGSGSINKLAYKTAANVAVLVTDSSEPGVVLNALSTAFEENKDDLGNALEARLKAALGEE